LCAIFLISFGFDKLLDIYTRDQWYFEKSNVELQTLFYNQSVSPCSNKENECFRYSIRDFLTVMKDFVLIYEDADGSGCTN
jgi:hypothetical protein